MNDGVEWSGAEWGGAGLLALEDDLHIHISLDWVKRRGNQGLRGVPSRCISVGRSVGWSVHARSLQLVLIGTLSI